MQLPFFKKKIIETKTYLGFFLKENEGLGFVIKMDGTNLIVQDQEKFVYSNGWDNLVQDIDQLILKLEERTKTHLQETIFFVYSHFIDEKTKEIKKQYLAKIKDLVKNLDLKALGYIECYEAVLHFLEKKEELPLTALLIELDISNLSVFVYKRGKLTYSKTIPHTDNLIDDLLSSFSEIKGKFLLPSRIILYNSKDLDDESAKILTYHWSEELFIQLPRVEIIKEQEIVDGMLGVFGNQLNSKEVSISTLTEVPKQEVLGFVIGSDVEKKKAIPKQEVSTEPMILTTKSFTLPFTSEFTKIKAFIIKLVKLPGSFAKKWLIVLGVIFIILGLFLNEYFFHKANLTIYLPYQSINKNLDLTDAVKIETNTKTSDFTVSKSTSGTKEIGDKATGVVTIHNFADNEKDFSKGTVLTASGFNFTLNSDVKVASASVVTIEGGLVKQPGKTNVNVTAQDIGPQGNIAAAKQFTIDGLPTTIYFAINNSAFSGGSKKEVKTVSQKDMDDLKSQLTDKAKQQSLNDIAQNKDQSLKLIKQLTTTDLSQVKYSKELGEEADSLTLQAKVSTTLYYYKENDLTDKIINQLKADINSGYLLKKDNLTYEISKVNQKNSSITLALLVKGKAIKDISQNVIMGKIIGANKNNLEKILKNNFNVQGFKFNIEPKIPLMQDWMPFFQKNITLKISTL